MSNDAALDRYLEAVARVAGPLRLSAGKLHSLSVQAVEQVEGLSPEGLETAAWVLEQVAPDKEPRPLGAYPGGKFKSRKQIVGELPDHRYYVEVFGGSGAVLLAKEPAEWEIYNDCSKGMSDLTRILADSKLRPKLIRRWMEVLPAVDVWLERFLTYREALRLGRAPADIEPDEIERALVVLTGWLGWTTTSDAKRLNFQAPAPRIKNSQTTRWKNALSDVARVGERLTSVQIYRMDWRRLIGEVDKLATALKWKPRDILFYLDPPYYAASLNAGSRNLYGTEDEFLASDHEALVDWACRTKCSVAISGQSEGKGNPYPKLEENGFRRVDISFNNRASTAGKSHKEVERLWVRP